MVSANVRLSEEMIDFVQHEMNQRGMTDIADYFQSLLLEEKKRREQEVVALLLEGIHSGPATPMTEEDWEELYKKAYERHLRKCD